MLQLLGLSRLLISKKYATIYFYDVRLKGIFDLGPEVIKISCSVQLSMKFARS